MSFIDNVDNIPELNNSSKLSEDYSFDASNSLVVVNDSDLEKVLFIYNETAQRPLYRLGSDTLTAETFNNEIKLDFDTSSMSDDDKLIIIYKKVDVNIIVDLLEEIRDELKINNKLLNKIYK